MGLTRVCNPEVSSSLVVIMSEPSTATAYQDDQTTRVLKNFAKKQGYGKLELYNLYNSLKDDDLDWLRARLNGKTEVVVAWGFDRHQECQSMFDTVGFAGNVKCFDQLTKGAPAMPTRRELVGLTVYDTNGMS